MFSARSAFLLLSLLLATCAKTGEGNDLQTVVLVTVSGITSDLRVLRATATLDGVRAESIETFVASPPAQQFGMRLPGSSGLYALAVEGLTANGCVVSRGSAAMPVNGLVRLDLTVILEKLVTPDCAAVPAACSDEAQNGMETDVDCGGPECSKCEVGRDCGEASDCLTNRCVAGKCAPTSQCMNGMKDAGETDVDCGGPTCAKCQVGQGCMAASDCVNGSCVAGKCADAPFTVTKIEPTEGPVNKTIPVTITGTGFVAGMTVNIGAVAATSVMVNSATQLQAVAPARATAAIVDVVLQLPGSGSATLPKGFRYYSGPVNFNAPLLSATSGGTEGIVVADLNGDGKLDAAATYPNGNEIIVFIGNGDGKFQAGVRYATNTGPVRIAAGDLTGDGKPELVVTNVNADVMSLFTNNGNGTFAAKRDVTTASGCVGVIIADVNGDGKQDVVNAHRGGDNGVSVHLGNGDGTIQARADLIGGSSPNDLIAADLNGDGKQDLIVANITNSYIGVLINKGGGAFENRALYTTPFFTFGLVAGDFTGDGKLDVAVSSAGGTQIALFPGNGNGTLGTSVLTNVSAGVRALGAADLDGDGKLDTVVLSTAGANILLGKGDGTFLAPVPVPGLGTGTVQGAGYTLALKDMNLDGKIDLVAANGTSVAVMLGSAN